MPLVLVIEDDVDSNEATVELLARKATTPSIAATPVIVITGITPVPKVENVVAILQKPFTSDELLSLVRTFAPMPEPEAA